MLVYHDYRGSGRSEVVPSATYTYGRVADDVESCGSTSAMNASANWLTAWAASLDSKTAYDILRRALAWSWLAPPPRATPRKIAGPALRALGPTRTAKALALGAWYAAAWSWRSESKDKHAARYAAMAVTQEGIPSVRVKVKAAMAGRPVPNDTCRN